MKNIVWLRLILSLLTIFGIGAVPAWAADCGGAAVCACGDTVVANYNFPANLTCGDNNPPGESVNGLTVAGGITVNLKGFKLTGTGQQGVGLLLQGCGGSIQNGRIQGFDVGIASDGWVCDWWIGVENPLSVTNHNTGLNLFADDSTITDTAADSNAHTGVVLRGDRNTVAAITCSKNGGHGLLVVGDDNSLTHNRCERNGGDGVHGYGDFNTLIRNLSQSNGGHGIIFTGVGNSFQRNQGKTNAGDGVIGIGTDLESDGHNYGNANGGENCHIDGFPTTGGGKYC